MLTRLIEMLNTFFNSSFVFHEISMDPQKFHACLEPFDPSPESSIELDSTCEFLHKWVVNFRLSLKRNLQYLNLRVGDFPNRRIGYYSKFEKLESNRYNLQSGLDIILLCSIRKLHSNEAFSKAFQNYAK